MTTGNGVDQEGADFFIRTTNRWVGIVCLSGVALLLTVGLLMFAPGFGPTEDPIDVFGRGFSIVWHGGLGLLGLLFLSWTIRADRLEVYVKDGVLHWVDERSTDSADTDRGSVPVELVKACSIVNAPPPGGGTGTCFHGAVLELTDGSTIRLPPNVARALASKRFLPFLRKYSRTVERKSVMVTSLERLYNPGMRSPSARHRGVAARGDADERQSGRNSRIS